MHSVLSIVRLLLFVVSMGGYALYLYKKTKINLEFIPAIVCCGISCLLYIAGLLNILLYTTYAIFLTGLGLTIYFIIKKQLNVLFNKSSLSVGVAWFVIASCFFTVYLRGTPFTQFDDFSHWGIVVKDMLISNHLPDSQSAVITFPSYPPSSSLFVYFLSRIIGISESKMLISQAYFMLALTLPLFGISKKGKHPAILALAASVFMIIGQRSFTALSVDTLLPLSGISATIIIYHYRENIKKASLLALPVMIVTILMKNSGAFFALINSILLLYLARKSTKAELDKKKAKALRFYAVGVIFLTFLMLLLWQLHIKYVFPETVSKHDMSIVNYEQVVSEKSSQDISDTVHRFLNKLFDINTISSMTLLIINIGTILVLLFSRLIYKRKMPALLACLVLSDILFILYQIGNLGVYVFSMSNSESLKLASYDRYVSSITIYIFGLLAFGFCVECDKTDQYQPTKLKVHVKSYVCFSVMLLTLISSGIVSIQSAEYVFTADLPREVEALVGDQWEYNPASYLIYSDDPFYTYHLVMYKTLSAQIDSIDKLPSGNDFLRLVASYDYFLVLNDDPSSQQLMKPYCGQTDCRGLYSVQETFFER